MIADGYHSPQSNLRFSLKPSSIFTFKDPQISRADLLRDLRNTEVNARGHITQLEERLQASIRAHETALATFNSERDAPIRRRKGGLKVTALVEQIATREDVLEVVAGPTTLPINIAANEIGILFRPVIWIADTGVLTLTTPLWLRLTRVYPYVLGGDEIGHPHFRPNDACVGSAANQLHSLACINDPLGTVEVLARLRKGWNRSSELARAWRKLAWEEWYSPHPTRYPNWDGRSYENGYTGEYKPWEEWFGIEDINDEARLAICHSGTIEQAVSPSSVITYLQLQGVNRDEYCRCHRLFTHYCLVHNLTCRGCTMDPAACFCIPLSSEELEEQQAVREREEAASNELQLEADFVANTAYTT
jgi:hypothetical protein